MRSFIVALFLLYGVLALTSCGGYSQGTPATTAPPSALASSETRVSIKGFGFVPAEVVIGKGTKVTWTNEDSVPHIVTGSNFDSGNLNRGQSWSKTFDAEGTYEYRCSLHPSMKGKVVVK